MPLDWGFSFVGLQRVRPISSGRLGDRGVAKCVSWVTLCVPSGGRCIVILGPCNGLSYAVGPGWTCSCRDGNMSPRCILSGAAPPYPNWPCTTSSHPVMVPLVPGWTCSCRDVNMSPRCILSGAAPPYPTWPCTTSSHPGTRGTITGESGVKCPPILLR